MEGILSHDETAQWIEDLKLNIGAAEQPLNIEETEWEQPTPGAKEQTLRGLRMKHKKF
jgi:hypothetical protein